MPLKHVRCKNLFLLTPEIPVKVGVGWRDLYRLLFGEDGFGNSSNIACPCFYAADIVTFVPI